MTLVSISLTCSSRFVFRSKISLSFFFTIVSSSVIRSIFTLIKSKCFFFSNSFLCSISAMFFSPLSVTSANLRFKFEISTSVSSAFFLIRQSLATIVSLFPLLQTKNLYLFYLFPFPGLKLLVNSLIAGLPVLDHQQNDLSLRYFFCSLS